MESSKGLAQGKKKKQQEIKLIDYLHDDAENNILLTLGVINDKETE